MKVFAKDPSDIRDYSRKAGKFLGSATISTSTWILDSGITNENSSNDANSATIRISGGTAGQQYTVTNRILASDGRQKDLSFILKIDEQ